MKIDKSSYYPESPLDDDEADARRGEQTQSVSPYAPNYRAPEPTPEPAAAHEPEHEPAPAVAAAPAETPAAAPRQTSGVANPITHNEKETYFSDPDLQEPHEEAGRFATSLSHLLSWLLVPLMMPVYGIIFLFGLSILSFASLQSRVVFTLIVAAINMLLPALVVLMLKRFGLVDDIGLNGRKERLIPYIITILCMAGTGWLLYAKGAPEWLLMFFLGGAVAGVIEVTVNCWWKISAHCAGIAGLCALLVHIMQQDYYSPATFWWLLVTILLSGLLGTARLWLNRHTVTQVLAGYAVGFCSVYFMMMIR